MISEELVDLAARHQVYLERFKAGEVRKTDVLFLKLEGDLRKLLAELREDDLSLLSNAQQVALMESVRKGQVELYTEEMTKLIATLKDLASFEREFELEAINAVTVDEVEPDDQNFAAALWSWVQARPMSATGMLLSAYLAAWATGEVTRGANLVRKAIAEGWSKSRLQSAFRGTRANGYRDGLFGSSKHNTATTINTAIQHVSAVARSGVEQHVILVPKGGGVKIDADGRVTTIARGATVAASLAGIKRGTKIKLLGYRWVSILDSKTSQTCRSLDGRVFPFGKGPLPPAHPRCRSTIVAEVHGRFLKRRDDTRPSAAGDVPAETTYYEWLKRQPAEFQDDALGVTRAALFRKGGLSAQQFAKLNLGKNFQPLTLVQMRKLAPRVFKRAGV